LFDNRGTKKSKEVRHYELTGQSPIKKAVPTAAKVEKGTGPVKFIRKK
jgi:hypothetical protein